MTIKDKILAELGELQSNARLNSKAYITALIAKGIVEKHFAPEVIPPQPAPAGLLEWLEKTIAQSERTAKDTCEDAYDITERGARENTLRLVIDKVRELGEARPDERVKGLADYLDACTEYYTHSIPNNPVAKQYYSGRRFTISGVRHKMRELGLIE